jgi:hypothetical protein
MLVYHKIDSTLRGHLALEVRPRSVARRGKRHHRPAFELADTPLTVCTASVACRSRRQNTAVPETVPADLVPPESAAGDTRDPSTYHGGSSKVASRSLLDFLERIEASYRLITADAA